MSRWAIIGAIAIGCGGARPDTRVGNELRAGKIVVRMARDGEIPPEPAASDPFAAASFATPCPLAGEPSRELFEPVLAYARDKLLGKENHGRPVRARLLVRGTPEPPSAKGLEISIEPRTQVGALEVADWWQDGGASTAYCLHVQHSGGDTIVLIKQKWSAISAVPPARGARRAPVASATAATPASR